MNPDAPAGTQPAADWGDNHCLARFVPATDHDGLHDAIVECETRSAARDAELAKLREERDRLTLELANVGSDTITLHVGPEGCQPGEWDCEEYHDEDGNQLPGFERCSHITDDVWTANRLIEHLEAMNRDGKAPQPEPAETWTEYGVRWLGEKPTPESSDVDVRGDSRENYTMGSRVIEVGKGSAEGAAYDYGRDGYECRVEFRVVTAGPWQHGESS